MKDSTDTIHHQCSQVVLVISLVPRPSQLFNVAREKREDLVSGPILSDDYEEWSTEGENECGRAKGQRRSSGRCCSRSA